MDKAERYARVLEDRENRKRELYAACEAALEGVDAIVFEAGCGHGHWLSEYASLHPERTCVGIDLVSKRIRRALAKRDKRELDNLHFFKAELKEFLEVLPPHIRLDLILFLFPDPWPKPRHHRRRMIQPDVLDALARRASRGALLCFRSDDPDYCQWAREHLDAHPEWEIDPAAAWPHEGDTYFQNLMESHHSLLARRLPEPAGGNNP